MSLSFFDSILRPLTSRWPLLLYAAAWTALLSATVAVASFLPEAAFVWAISPSSSFSRACDAEGFIRVPMDLPGEVLCLPAHLFAKFSMDLLVPPVFAAVVVAGSACLVRAMGLWEDDLPRWVRPRFRCENPKILSMCLVKTRCSALRWNRRCIWVYHRSDLYAEFILKWFFFLRKKKRKKKRKVGVGRAFNFVDNGFVWKRTIKDDDLVEARLASIITVFVCLWQSDRLVCWFLSDL